MSKNLSPKCYQEIKALKKSQYAREQYKHLLKIRNKG